MKDYNSQTTKHTDMTRKISGLLVLVMFLTTSYAQDIRLHGYGGYTIDSKTHHYGYVEYYNTEIKGGFSWGGGLEYRFHPNFGVELMYLNRNTEAPSTFYTPGTESADIKLSAKYVLVSGVASFTRNQRLDPYAGFMMGTALLDATNPATQLNHKESKFAWGLRGGLNFWATSRIGIKFEAQFITVPKGAGGELYFGSPQVAPAYYSVYSDMSQLTVSGGLSFKLGKVKSK